MLHGKASWSATHQDDQPEKVAAELTSAFKKLVASMGQAPNTLLTSSEVDKVLSLVVTPAIHAHLWRYAIATPPLNVGYMWDPERGVGVCGDWCNGSKVEGAFMSGYLLAKAML